MRHYRGAHKQDHILQNEQAREQPRRFNNKENQRQEQRRSRKEKNQPVPERSFIDILYLEHLWNNADRPDEFFFLFHVDDLNQCRQLMAKIYAAALLQNPDAILPEKIFLEEVPAET